MWACESVSLCFVKICLLMHFYAFVLCVFSRCMFSLIVKLFESLKSLYRFTSSSSSSSSSS